MFDAEDDATIFLKEAQKNVGSDIVTLNFCNHEGNLKPNKKGINSYIKYISGGGTWKITTLNSNGRKEKITSKQRSSKVNIPISYDDFKKDLLTSEQIKIINECLNKIETIEKFKESI